MIPHITSSLLECLRNNNAKTLLPKQPLSTTIIFILNFSAALQGRCRFRFAWKFLTCRHRLHIGWCSRQLTTLQIPREDVRVKAFFFILKNGYDRNKNSIDSIHFFSMIYSKIRLIPVDKT